MEMYNHQVAATPCAVAKTHPSLKADVASSHRHQSAANTATANTCTAPKA
jgi:hypothetical protein